MMGGFQAGRRHGPPVPGRGHALEATLLAAMLLFSALLASPAVAAPPHDTIRFEMLPEKQDEYVCTGHSTTIKVYLWRAIVRAGAPANEAPKRDGITGTPIDATVRDKSLGSITPERSFTALDSIDPDVAEFTFTAGNKPGTTAIVFEAMVKGFWIGSGPIQSPPKPTYVEETVDVEVRKCTFRAQLLLDGGVSGVVAWTGTTDEAVLNPDSQTHFSGSSPLYMAESWMVPECSISGQITTSPVDYSADLVGGALNLTFTIANWTHDVAGACFGEGFSSSASGTAPPISLALSSDGGVGSVPFPAGAYGGYTLIVTPYEEQVSALRWPADQRAWSSWPAAISLALP